jgi:hypothetical protein
MKLEDVRKVFQRVSQEKLFGETMVCIQAHNDDFDISLSGLAREYDNVLILTVTDAGTGHYIYAEEQGHIPDNGEVNKTWISPEGHEWNQTFHSLGLSNFRIRNMEDRYEHYGYISVRPDTRVPDAITYDASLGIQLEYMRQVSLELAGKLQDLGVKDYDLFIHDPELPEHLDHQLCGLIGSRVNELVPSRRLFYFYVYTVLRLPRYLRAYVEVHLEHKKELFSRVWENEFLPLKMWKKEPNDVFFRNELIMPANPLVGDILVKRSPLTLLFKLLRRVRIFLGFR